MNSNQSLLGVKAKEDLGNGLSAIALLEVELDADDPVTEKSSFNESEKSDGVAGRDQWVGMEGSFGKVRLGTMSTHYKDTGKMVDPFWQTSIEGRKSGFDLMTSSYHGGQGEELQGRAENTVRYDSPDWNGLSFAGNYTFDNDEADGENDDPFGLGAQYKNGGILAFVDYLDDSGEDAESVWKIGGSYTWNALTFRGQYEDGEVDNSINEELQYWFIGMSYLFGNTEIAFDYGQGEEEDDSGTSYDADTWRLAVMHSMSKRTKLYTGFMQNDDDTATDSEDDLFTLGVRHSF
jgi:predicted porin